MALRTAGPPGLPESFPILQPDRALSEPITTTKHGRDRLGVLSVEAYGRLQRRDRCVVTAGALTEAEIALIAAAEIPAEQAHLDEKIEDGHP